MEAVWGERPPVGASRSLDSYISRLRTQLGAERVVRQAPGHLLRLEPAELDLDRFETLVQHASELSASGDSRKAAQALRQALAIWRGPALADVQYEPVATGWVEELEERRLLAVEQRIDADLACGESASVVPEFQQLVRTRVHQVPLSSISYEERRRFQLSADGDWGPDYPSPSAFLPPFFGCHGGYTNGYVCDQELDRKMRRAASAQLRDPRAAARLWAEVDRMIVDRAYWVPDRHLAPAGARLETAPQLSVQPNLGLRRRPGLAALSPCVSS